jgi:hypothetical protein
MSLFVLSAVTAGALVTGAEILDRILAVVNGQIITLSDVRAVQRLELVPADVSTDPVDAGLQRMIDRQLMLEEVERYAPPEPQAADIDAAVADVRSRAKDALEFEATLTRYGMSHDELRRFVRDTLRLEAYRQQRLSSMPQSSDEEARRYYEDHPEEFTSDGQLLPFDKVRDQALSAALDERRSTFMRDWIDGLRRRASLLVLYLPGT